MELEYAKKVISDNCNCRENSLVYSLHEECCFSSEKFWEFYESITAFIGKPKPLELTKQITRSYQRILQEFIFHFDPADIAVMEHFPENYTDYLERIDFALMAYFSDDRDLIDDKSFVLQK